MTSRIFAVVALAGAAVTLAACSSSPPDVAPPTSTPASTSDTAAVSGTVTVLAAASLAGTFTTLGKQFEATYPGTTVKLSFGASSSLAQQINQGAPADVFASAAPKNMQQVTDTGAAFDPTSFVRNVMEIAVPPSNPAKVANLSDLARPEVKVALCQPQVPCGAAAAQVFQNAKITVTPVTREQDVKSTLTKVELNEVDAGVVYATDVEAAGAKVMAIPIPADVNASTAYLIATLSKAPNSAGAQAFVEYVLSPAGQDVLGQAGFARP